MPLAFTQVDFLVSIVNNTFCSQNILNILTNQYSSTNIYRLLFYLPQVCNSLEIKYNENDRLELGDLSAVCLTNPSSCSAGGTIAFWIKYDQSWGYSRVIGTTPRTEAGFEIGFNHGNLQ